MTGIFRAEVQRHRDHDPFTVRRRDAALTNKGKSQADVVKGGATCAIAFRK
jgi:hypothetical protein